MNNSHFKHYLHTFNYKILYMAHSLFAPVAHQSRTPHTHQKGYLNEKMRNNLNVCEYVMLLLPQAALEKKAEDFNRFELVYNLQQ